ncbi:leukotriene B4 receptor 1-like [Gigantopelta aegis]|uniref:leukotriene B4 receptor 1-like n=1 Tax=Gigantopelta aegis TaxID=1735272 RepID=UPI001B88D849|nr:leukotriene B4 receptor 1-like [Gigantopelta aegis]
MFNNSSINTFSVANTSPLHIIITVMNVILILLITVGNSFTIMAITRFRNLRHQSSVMIGALAMADVSMGVAYTPVKLFRTHVPYLFRLEMPCLIAMYIGHLAALAAIIFLSLLSLERFYAIQFPFHYHAHATVKVAVIVNVAVFIFIASALVPLFAGAAMWYDGVSCYAPTLYPSLYTRFIVAVAAIPLFLGFVGFIRVCVAEFRFRKQVFDQSVASLRKQESIRSKLIITAYVVSLCFWVPHMLYYLYDTVSKADQNVYLFRIVTLLDVGSSAVNCFLYAWKNSKFKTAYRELWGLKPSTEAIRPFTTNTVSLSHPL